MKTTNQKSVIIVGAGPAGLTAASELVNCGLIVKVLEKDPQYVGGIARTVEYKGYRFDIGGHRFFSKNTEITQWWQKRLPHDFIKVNRLSRIFYRGKFFDYPLKAGNALFNLGILNSIACVLSYGWAKLKPIKPEKSFADWVTNRFGRRLFLVFFKSYTEKVWGTTCDKISADWAAQRIKGLSLLQAAWHAFFPKKAKPNGQTIKTLIDQFEYPRLGPGMMWEKTARDIQAAGAKIHLGESVTRIRHNGHQVIAVETQNTSGERHEWHGDHFILSMPLRETVLTLDPPPNPDALQAAQNLTYRDFLTVALMVNRTNLFPDNWIYVHEPIVKLGRIQNFNNWSKEMVPNDQSTCLGLEYFCFEGDALWSLSDAELIELGKRELATLGLVKTDEVFDGTVVRMPKSYPVYSSDYQQEVKTIASELGKLTNLQVVGRNGMHKYNNQDHSMMTALLAARNLSGTNYDVWKVNTDAEYHEEQTEVQIQPYAVPPKPQMVVPIEN